MKKQYFSIIFSILISSVLSATDYTISTEGTSYTPSDLTVLVGDNITIEASNSHPTAEVSEETWNANGTAALAGGFGTSTSSITFTVESPGTIYYVCTSHVANFSMKGKINVNSVGVDEYTNEVDVQFGALPVMDGTLEYAIVGAENYARSIEVLSMNGQQVAFAEVTEADGQLALHARPGIYIVMLKDADGNIVFRETIPVK